MTRLHDLRHSTEGSKKNIYRSKSYHRRSGRRKTRSAPEFCCDYTAVVTVFAIVETLIFDPFYNRNFIKGFHPARTVIQLTSNSKLICSSSKFFLSSPRSQLLHQRHQRRLQITTHSPTCQLLAAHHASRWFLPHCRPSGLWRREDASAHFEKCSI